MMNVELVNDGPVTIILEDDVKEEADADKTDEWKQNRNNYFE